jgi:voltage-gated potassium channel Kch
MNPTIAIVARAHSTGDLEALRRGNVGVAIVPEFEGAVVIVREALMRLGVDEGALDTIARQIRDEEYALERPDAEDFVPAPSRP